MSDDALRACDVCHSRKVRCDRQLQCANCTDTGVECKRTRARRSRPKSSSVISALGERVLTLERALSESIENTSPSNVSSHLDAEPTSKKRKLDQVSRGEHTSPSARDECAIGSTTHHAEQARVVIQGELDGNEHMDRERKSILRSALQFVDVMAQGKATNTDKFSPFEMPCEYAQDIHSSITPSPELFYMLLPEPTAAVGRSSCIEWPDHISDKTLEKMASTVLGDDDNDHEHGQIFYQYCICIYVKAIFHLFQKPRAYKDPRINAQFLKSKKLYERRTFRALESLNFLNPPNLPFIQSLISAALFMQHRGNMSQAWILNSYAARLITALDYHEVCNPLGNSDLDEEIHSAVYWCFYLDRTLSTLLYRPLSLPEPRISPTNLISADQSLAYIPLIRILLDLAQIQGELLNCGKEDTTLQTLANHSKLQDRMGVIYSRLQSSRASAPEFISSDWIAGDFCYYAILVDILRSRLKYSFSPLTHKECLSYSRKSLKALNHLQRNLTDSPGFVDPYPSFLTWTVLLYPLSPFFVLFCNIIGELDMDDYSLIQDITQNLSQFAASPYISKLHKLLDTLQNFCVPLIQAKQRIGPQVKVANLYPSMTSTQQGCPAHANEPGHPLANASYYMDPCMESNPQQLLTPSDGSYPPDDQLMWQLFNSQLSLEWFESNLYSY
ncbi:transcriptional regulator family: Fungal Specific TF [Penicillium paradoxum]|uniref:transcriptional regulator family: Fungal Specific TF n=1 Tax=Penicillium paradoxum TaxID=176176 RepID=UPI0025489020|nr:transcriptional regulator family: Fungal Specific TF [Penicillium paradoxum]KAJ5794629.1 transcriptional regulator family: Fungal Specific TF [Penicillium paradoxum]